MQSAVKTYYSTLNKCSREMFRVTAGMSYSDLLKQYHIRFTKSGHWLLAGEEKKELEFYISTTVLQAKRLLHTILPVLKKHQTTFQLVCNTEFHYQLNGGRLGIEQVGKALVLYPAGEDAAFTLIADLLPLLNDYEAPAVMEDCLLFRSNLYIPVTKKKSLFVEELRKLENGRFCAYPVKKTVIGTNVPVKLLKRSPKGNIYKGYSLKKLSFTPCVIKEGRAWMAEDVYGRFVRDRLLAEKNALEYLAPVLPVPKILDYMETGNDSYLVTEYIEGTPIGEMLLKLSAGRKWYTLAEEIKYNIIKHLVAVVELVEQLHDTGYVHRDINEENILVNKSGQHYLIDFELAYQVEQQNPLPPFFYGMPGYAAPEQSKHKLPAFSEDIYSIGALIASALTGMNGETLASTDHKKLCNILNNRVEQKSLIRIAGDCLETEPKRRPVLQQIKEQLSQHL